MIIYLCPTVLVPRAAKGRLKLSWSMSGTVPAGVCPPAGNGAPNASVPVAGFVKQLAARVLNALSWFAEIVALSLLIIHLTISVQSGSVKDPYIDAAIKG